MIWLLTYNYGAYTGYRSPDLITDAETDYYFSTEEAAKAKAREFNASTYERYCKSKLGDQDAYEKAVADWEQRMKEWHVLEAAGFEKPRPKEPKRPDAETPVSYEEWFAGLDRWSDESWYDVIAVPEKEED